MRSNWSEKAVAERAVEKGLLKLLASRFLVHFGLQLQ